MKTWIIGIGICFGFSLLAMGQRFYMKDDMERYNTFISLQEHLDSLRITHGNDLQVSSFVQSIKYNHDSIALEYDEKNRIEKASIFSLHDDTTYYFYGIYTFHYNKKGNLILMDYLVKDTGYYSNRYHLSYNKKGQIEEAMYILYTETK